MCDVPTHIYWHSDSHGLLYFVDCEQPYDESDYVYSSHTQDLRAHGVGESCVINIDLNTTLNVVESKDNTDIVQNVKDLRRVIEGKAKKTVNGWLEVCVFLYFLAH